MERLNKDARRYLRQIRGWLPCAGRMKRKMLECIKVDILEFLSENPDADYKMVVARFGTPQQIASSYVEEAETGELLRVLKTRRKVITIVVTTAVMIVSIWAGAVAFIVTSDAHKADGYYEVEITQIERNTVG